MSKVEVNQVTQQCGTTLTVGGGACKTAVVDATTVTLGRCGGTVSLASGATQSGFGRTGTVDWITTPKVTGDSPITAVTGKGYFLNTTAGVITFNLPAGAAGSIVSLADYAGTWQTNNVTVNANGTEKIGGVDAAAVLSTIGQSVTFVYVDSTQGWVNTMDSTSNVRGNAYLVATGGTPCAGTTCGDYKIHKFTGPGTFCVSTAALCAADNLVSYMVVAGGGGGGARHGGGGGGGGFRELVSPTAPYTASPLDGYATPGNRITVTASPYAITVGGGGTPGGGPTSPAPGTAANGAISVFSTITSAGGGYGGGYAPGANYVGGAGASGGGGNNLVSGDQSGAAGGAGNTPPTTPAQGFSGGNGGSDDASFRGAGGGGGATAVGTNVTPGGPAPSPVAVGCGGAGATTSISATPTAYAGGGGGASSYVAGTGGIGGGGAGKKNTETCGEAGTINTGGGGGGTGDCVQYKGGLGGSGIVIIRYRFQ